MKVKITKLQCERCGHQWIPKKEEVRQCPKCKSAYWDKPKVKEV
jgi:Zn finger protein HypA/HybF involved in hydrogenase expression